MFVLAKRNIILKAQGGEETLTLKRDCFAEVPERFTAGWFFAELVKDGEIVVPETRNDKDVETASGLADAKLKEARVAQQTRKTRKN